eukprot:Ihof_evm9s98 gene=Ihof_evmTU9s98
MPSKKRTNSPPPAQWGNWIDEVIAKAFYSHGYFCATHPIIMFSLVFIVLMACFIPLSTLSASVELMEPRVLLWTGRFVPDSTTTSNDSTPMLAMQSINLNFPRGITTRPRLLKALMSVGFHIHEAVLEADTVSGSKQSSNLCYTSVLQPGRCLLTSPVEYWMGNHSRLIEDDDVMHTLRSEGMDSYGGRLYMDAMLGEIDKNQDDQLDSFGTLSVNVFLLPNINDPKRYSTFMTDLSNVLSNAPYWKVEAMTDSTITHCFYEFGLGFVAVVTVISSLFMAIAMCTTLGMTLTLVAVEVIPFFIIAIGVENIFYITNAVVTTSLDLPVRERVAEGLAKAGAPVLLSLAAKLSLTALGTLTSIPALREFCIFTFVSVVADFFMQVTLFITVLSIDIRRMELSDLQNHHQKVNNIYNHNDASLTDSANMIATSTCHKLSRAMSFPSLDSKGLAARPTKKKRCLGLGKSALIALCIIGVGVCVLQGSYPFKLLVSSGLTPRQPDFSLYGLLHHAHGIALDGRYIELLPPLSLTLTALPINDTVMDVNTLTTMIPELPSEALRATWLVAVWRRFILCLMQTDWNIVGICVLVFEGAMVLVWYLFPTPPTKKIVANPASQSVHWAQTGAALVHRSLLGHEHDIEWISKEKAVLVSCDKGGVVK